MTYVTVEGGQETATVLVMDRSFIAPGTKVLPLSSGRDFFNGREGIVLGSAGYGMINVKFGEATSQYHWTELQILEA